MKHIIMLLRLVLNFFVNIFFKITRPSHMFRRLPLPLWYKIAIEELGVMEYRGFKPNPRILEYQGATSLQAKEDEVPWCASFVCWCLEQAGEIHPASARSRDFMGYGKSVINKPREGAIVVMQRTEDPTKGHVGFFVRRDDKHVWVLGGNQRDRVGIDKYPIERVLDYRWPR